MQVFHNELTQSCHLLWKETFCPDKIKIMNSKQICSLLQRLAFHKRGHDCLCSRCRSMGVPLGNWTPCGAKHWRRIMTLYGYHWDWGSNGTVYAESKQREGGHGSGYLALANRDSIMMIRSESTWKMMPFLISLNKWANKPFFENLL